MSLAETRHAQLFPVLTAPQIALAKRFASAPSHRFAANEQLFAPGQSNTPAYLVTAGEIHVTGGDQAGGPSLDIIHGPGQITGEISQLAGRPSLAGGMAGPDGCEAMAFDAPHLRAMLIGSAELGELLMRALILRRTALIAEGGAGSVLVGRPGSPALSRLEGFLARNSHPYTVVDCQADHGELADRLGLHEEDLPVVICPDGQVLRHPTLEAVATAVGITPQLDPARIYDLVIVGAGPAGLAAAVYAASEGLSPLVLDTRAIGGQAGASARIENYLGFPTGITGQALMGRAFSQAQKFGAEIAVPLSVERLDCCGADRRPGDPFTLHLSNGNTLSARIVVIASGARYKRPDIADLDMFDGAGVSYWATPVEARLCGGEEVALVGAGNSAGQAVAFLAPKVARLHLVVRGDGLEASMSRYLIERIAALPNVELHTRTEVTRLTGTADRGLTEATFRNRDTGAESTRPLRHLFLFIGADPNTAWLEGCAVALDRRGFVITGETLANPAWKAAGRAPLSLETSVPGVFAIGDVRAGSTKRVAAAVGEGAAAVAQVHAVLAG